MTPTGTDTPEDGSRDEKSCPLAAVDRRLEDAHRLWHQAEQSYFDPEAFRLAAQGTIQTLRTVTFILQNHKHVIPDFDDWYQPWQERLKEDALMRWMVDTRNKIEKQGDLEAQSFVRAEIVVSYLDEGPSIEVPAELFDDPGVLLQRIPKGAVRRHVMENGTLRVQRRWVENSLPDHELLDALAVAYGRLAEVVHDAHHQMGLLAPSTVNVDTKQRYDRSDMEWRMPCMIGHEEPRSLLISLSDGSILSFGQETICFDPDKAEEVKGTSKNRKFGPFQRDG